ncbi:hypothetical protein BGW42_004826 [Actinomortierella wolfii]|nr:hypothetical protein BGW42_004826 [Actinomortierella wolfii]
MKRLNIFTLFIAVLALLSACTVLAQPTLGWPISSDLFELDHPARGSTYNVGQNDYVHATTKGGKKGEIYKKNPNVRLRVQINVRLPWVNEVIIEKIPYRTLADKGFFFEVKEEYINKRPYGKGRGYRVRASFDGSYVDSNILMLKKD